MAAFEILQDIVAQRAERVIKAFVAAVERLVLVHQPRPVRRFVGSQGYVGHNPSYPDPRLKFNHLGDSRKSLSTQEADMTINTERDIEANLQIGPTDRGMVRLYVEAPGVEIPMDFDPEEAEEIAEELRAAAAAARGQAKR